MTVQPGSDPEPIPPLPPDYETRRAMRRQAEAGEFVRVGASPEGRDIALEPAAARAWEGMRAAAASSGIELIALSGFRSVRRQAEIVREKLRAGQSMEAVLAVLAAPGYSEHHTGRAVDIGTPGAVPLTEDFERSEAFRWLRAHAHEHGFRLSYPRGNPNGIAYEPWHWCHGPA